MFPASKVPQVTFRCRELVECFGFLRIPQQLAGSDVLHNQQLEMVPEKVAELTAISKGKCLHSTSTSNLKLSYVGTNVYVCACTCVNVGVCVCMCVHVQCVRMCVQR